jgi:hypothetical protein
MTRFVYSLAAACPADLAKDADAICEGMGWGPGTFSVPLTASKGVTHRGVLTRATAETVAQLSDPPREAASVMSAVLVSIKEAPAQDDPAHWAEFLKTHGLSLADEAPI